MSDETIGAAQVVGFDPIIIRGPQGNPGVLVLNVGDPIPPGTPAGTIIFRRTS